MTEEFVSIPVDVESKNFSSFEERVQLVSVAAFLSHCPVVDEDDRRQWFDLP